jgi:hypothetical protein
MQGGSGADSHCKAANGPKGEFCRNGQNRRVRPASMELKNPRTCAGDFSSDKGVAIGGDMRPLQWAIAP